MIVKQASINDYTEIKKFIKIYWSKNHILAKDKKLFKYYYLNKKKFNFLILKNKNNQINSILGYLVDKKENEKFVWLALWISKPNSFFAGVRLLKELENRFKEKVLVLGLSNFAEKIIRTLNYKVLFMSHYYILNKKIKNYKIILNPQKKKYEANKNIFFSEIKKKDLFKFKNLIHLRNNKNFSNFKFKYIDNKYYDYKFFIIKKKKDNLLLVLREILVKKKKRSIIRIVDAFGNFKLFKICNKFYDYLFEIFNSEYLDILNIGINEKIFLSSGMVKANYTKTTIPNYFEPFLKKNKKIIFAHHYKLKKKNICF